MPFLIQLLGSACHCLTASRPLAVVLSTDFSLHFLNHQKSWPLKSGRKLSRSPKPENLFCSPSAVHLYITRRIKILHHTRHSTKMNPFQRLPNEIIDAIFTNMHPVNVWRFQQSAKSSERALDPHLRTRPYALDKLMEFGCKNGNNKAVRKAVSLGADVSVMTISGCRG